MKFTSLVTGQTGSISLEGRFTFETHPAFRACTRDMLGNPSLQHIVLDMAGITHMDASSLGVILLLREATLAQDMSITLVRPSATVMPLLRLIQFEKLFEIVS